MAFACNLTALAPGDRERLRELGLRFTEAVEGSTELSNGYTFPIDPARFSLTDAAEWMSLERKCCPFFEFQLDPPSRDGGAFQVTLRGAEGVKAVILSEFPGLRLGPG